MPTSTNYQHYIQMASVSAGAILDRLIRQQKRTKVEVAAAAQIIPQRLNDLIMGNRRFTPQTSLAMETALGIDITGFFYLLQANHDIYLAQKELASQPTPDLNVLTKTTFWDVDLKKIDWSRCKTWAISRVLEYGSAEEIREMDRFYGHEAVTAVLEQPNNFRLYDQVKKRISLISV